MSSLIPGFSSVQSLSYVQLFMAPWIPAPQPSLSITNSRSLLKLMSIELVMPFNHLILCCPPFLLPSIFPRTRVFADESILHIRYWSFSFSIDTSNEYSGLISIRMDWLDLLEVQRDSQESPPIAQFKSINPLDVSFLYSPTLISIYDYWKNHNSKPILKNYQSLSVSFLKVEETIKNM